MQDLLSSFIRSVGSSNLETFHSKAIAWTLNELKPESDFFKWLFRKATGRDCNSCQRLGSVAELSQHDLVTTLQVTFKEGDPEIHLIIWENKIKADFSQKAISQLPKSSDSKTQKELENYENSWLRGVSQPYWYQLRWLLWKHEHKNKLEKFLKLVAPTIEPKELRDVHWLVLSPFDEGELNGFYRDRWIGSRWREDESLELKGDRDLVKSIATDEDALHDWRFCSFNELSESLKKHLGKSEKHTVLGAYVAYVHKNLSSPESIYSSVDEKESNHWTPNRLIEVYDKLKDDSRFMFFWSIGGSSNSAFPLLNISMRPRGNFESVCQFSEIDWVDNNKKVAKSRVDYVLCSIQIQKTVKLQFAHKAYDHVKIGSPKRYVEGIHRALGNNNCQDKEARLSFVQNQLASTDKFEITRENLARKKTGLSYSVERNNEKDTEKIKSTEDILHLVQLTAQAFTKS